MALTVDHVLRPGSGGEALQVGEWLADFGIRHVVLPWVGVKPSRGIQAAAREARYRLMCDWAGANGSAQLLVAHNLEDQAETFLMRLRRGAGVYGLASMASQIRRLGVAIHRPLLGIPRTRLRQTLAARGQPWIEDPSNENPAFERTSWRALVAALESRGFDVARLAGLAHRCAQIRSQMDVLADTVIADACNRHGSGYAELQAEPLAGAPEVLAIHTLRRLLGEIGGCPYPANVGKLERGLRRLLDTKDQRSFTLARCRIIKPADGGATGPILICREERQTGERVPVAAGGRVHWRGVFEIGLEGRARGCKRPVYLGPLGKAGWSEIASKLVGLDGNLPPYPVRTALPALFDGAGVTEVPHLGYVRAGDDLPRVTVGWVRSSA